VDVVAGPLPYADPAYAMEIGINRVQPVWSCLFARDDDVHVVAGPKAVVRNREQRVRVGGEIDPDDVGLLVHNVVDEAGVLMGEAVVVLAPYVRGQQVVE